jgi:hypothetical protein
MFIVLGGMTPMSQDITVNSTMMSGTRIMVFWHGGS